MTSLTLLKMSKLLRQVFLRFCSNLWTIKIFMGTLAPPAPTPMLCGPPVVHLDHVENHWPRSYIIYFNKCNLYEADNYAIDVYNCSINCFDNLWCDSYNKHSIVVTQNIVWT